MCTSSRALTSPRPTPAAQADPAALFAAAVRAGADAQVDWLWLHAQMTAPFERLYCIEKALTRDPHSPHARRALSLLAESR